jgi:hypothetical protein
VLSTNRKGAIAEAKITTAAIELGIPVLKPVAEHGRYDLAFEIADRIYRVQCKWGNLDGSVVKVNLTSSWCTPTGYERRSYSVSEIDLSPSIATASAVATFSRARLSLAGERSICGSRPPATDRGPALT